MGETISSLVAVAMVEISRRMEESEDQEAAVSLAALLEDSDKQVGLAVKAVVEQRLESSFEKALGLHARRKQLEVRRICAAHYEDFAASVDSLLAVKEDLAMLRERAVAVNKGVQESGEVVLAKARQLMEFRRLRQNLAEALALVSSCQYIMQLAAKAMEQIAVGKYFSALRTLEQLQRNQLAEFREFEFVEFLEQQIPIMLFAIRQSVKAQFDEWLQSVIAVSEELGALAMVQVSEQLGKEDKKNKHRRRMWLGGKNTQKAVDDMARRSNISERDEFTNLGEVELFEKFKLDFSVVYQCLHIYENLNIGDTFIQFYKESRKRQACLAYENTRFSGKDFLEFFHSYFASIAGFFIIEDAVLRSGNELLSRAEVDDLWELAIGRIKVILIEQFSYITNPESFIRIKETIVLFCKTLDQYSLNTLPLTSFLANHRDKYEEILVQKFREEVTSIFFEEKYEPLTIKTSKDYDKLVNAYQLEIEFEDLDIEKHTTEEKSEIYVNEEAQVFETVFTEDIEDNLLSPISTKTDASHTGYVSDSENSTSFPRIKFPITVAFSITVPKICKLTKRFIHDYYVFARNLRTMDDAIRIAVETIFINEVNDHMNTILDKSTELNISQAVQIAINANQFTHVCTFFERYLSTFLNTRSLLDIEEVSIRLNSARNAFTRTASRAQDLIFELVNSKIEVFLTSLGGNTNWMPSRPNKHPSGIIQDLIAYLETTFMCLNFLPKHIRLGIHFTSCRHVSGIILRELLHTKKYNAIAMYNLGLDIQALEEFASRQNIPRLMDAFSEIRQIVDLILSGDIEQILDKPTRDSKFPFVSTEKLVTILEKFKELGILNVTVDGVPKIKKSTVLAVVKRLKS